VPVQTFRPSSTSLWGPPGSAPSASTFSAECSPSTEERSAPGTDSLEWEDLEITHGQFLTAMLTDSIGQFYESFRWDGWREEVAVLALDRGISLYPPLSTAEGKHPNISSRRAVPMAELVGEHWPTGAQDEDRQNG
jgi:hypothetical protein